MKSEISVGYQRGIDFYDESELGNVILRARLDYARSHGRLPNIRRPVKFNEKIVWSKFFRAMKVPESGNKLLTSYFIPEGIASEIRCPEIVWQSAAADLPGNNQIEPGEYYLKSNHGSGNVLRISYPLTDERKRILESYCREWLSSPFGLATGEWWYNAFQRKIFIEQAVTTAERSVSWNFYVFKGKTPFVVAYKKLTKPAESNYYDGELGLLPEQNPDRRRVAEALIDKHRVLEQLLPLARIIGEGSSFMRVDLFLGDDQCAYLNEITFSPGNAGLIFTPQLDLHLGNHWHL